MCPAFCWLGIAVVRLAAYDDGVVVADIADLDAYAGGSVGFFLEFSIKDVAQRLF